jgi:hypothetical protein
MIDIDITEYCSKCGEPLALIETAIDKGQEFKPTRVTVKLAQKAGIKAYLIYYKILEKNVRIGRCRVQQLFPVKTPLQSMSDIDVGNLIVQIHDSCECRPTPHFVIPDL